MGRISVEVDTDEQKVQMTATKCTNMDFCAMIIALTRNAAKGKMITDMDVVLMAKAFVDDIVPNCPLKIMDEEEKPRHKSETFDNMDDTMKMFDELLRETSGEKG